MSEEYTVAAGATTTDKVSTDESEQVMGMLSDHVPLSLIMDLAAPQGPHSDDILDAEGAPDGNWWEHR